MNKVVLFSLIAFIALSCKKDVYTDAADPDWLKDRIAADEETIKNYSQSGLDMAAWIRYEWQSLYFYDYINPNNSSGSETYTYEGERIYFSYVALAQYHAERCCEVMVWKGAKYQ